MGRKAVSTLFYLLSLVLTGLLLAAAVASWRASYISPEQGRFWASLALTMPVILLLNLGALIYWLVCGKWAVALMPAAALLCNMGYIASMLQLPDLPDWGGDRGSAELRVATLNTYGFRRYDTKELSAYAVARLISREKADVFCMQEFPEDKAFPPDTIAAFFTRTMPYFVYGTGAAIVSRYPILDHRYVRFPDSWNDYLWADLRVGADTVRVISVHLQTSGISSLRGRFKKDYNRDAPVDQMFGTMERNSRIRAQQVREIRSLIDSTRYPLVLCGDFNDTPSSYTYRRMKGRLTDGFREAGSGYGGTFRYLGGVLRIDYILYNDAFRGVRYFTPRDDVSDHKAVIAELRFNR